MIWHFLYVLCCFILDQVLILLFPSSYLLQQMIFIPSLGFCAILLTVRKFDLLSGVLFAFGFGLFYELFFSQTFMIYPLVYSLCVLLLKYWSKQVGYSLVESMLLCSILVFVKDFIVYLLMLVSNMTKLSFMNWLCNIELFSIGINTILIIFIFLILNRKDDLLMRKNIRLKSEEKLSLDIFKFHK